MTTELQTETVKFTTRELRITREMSLPEFVRSVRGAMARIAREVGVSHQAVQAVVSGKKRSARISRAVNRWIQRELARRRAS